MHQYRRIISYLYKYNHGQKGENTGFIRVETRKEGIRIHLHIRDLRMSEERKLRIYFYIHQEERLRLIYVDEFVCQRGNCEYKNTTVPDMADVNFDEIHGVVFLDQQSLVYGSCWDERDIQEERFFLADAERSDVKRHKSIEKRRETLIEDVKESPGNETEEPKISAISGREEGRESPGDEAEELRRLHTSEVTEKSQSSEFLQTHPRIILNDADNLIQAVRIRMDDLSRLSHRDWKLADNAFLQQAYETEGHLMVGRIHMPNDTTVWVLGVPGCYHNREKYLAGIFGFTDYIPQEETEFRTGGKGYWIRQIAPVE